MTLSMNGRRYGRSSRSSPKIPSVNLQQSLHLAHPPSALPSATLAPSSTTLHTPSSASHTHCHTDNHHHAQQYICPDHHTKEETTHTYSLHFHGFHARTTQKISPHIQTPQNQPHNAPNSTPHHQFHHLHHENRTQHQNFNHCHTVHLQYSYAQHCHYPHHSYTCHSHHYSHHYHQHHHLHHLHRHNQHHHQQQHHRNYHHHHQTNTNPIPYGPRHFSPTQIPHTLIAIKHSLGIIPHTPSSFPKRCRSFSNRGSRGLSYQTCNSDPRKSPSLGDSEDLTNRIKTK